MSSVASEGSPCNSLSVNARGIAGSPGRAGGGACGAITSALCGNTPSWLRKSISVCQPTGTTSESCPSRNPRSEEHTSELQSRSDLVCRLLLEKKKNNLYTQCATLLT